MPQYHSISFDELYSILSSLKEHSVPKRIYVQIPRRLSGQPGDELGVESYTIRRRPGPDGDIEIILSPDDYTI